jgi:hypothetical protein
MMVDEEAVRLERLDDEDMAAFVRDGFVTFQLDDLPTEWHEAVAADARAVHDVSPGDQSTIWKKLAPKMEQVVTNPRFRGVLRSLAGPDYIMQPAGHMHLSNTTGQSFRERPNLVLCHCTCAVMMTDASAPRCRQRRHWAWSSQA